MKKFFNILFIIIFCNVVLAWEVTDYLPDPTYSKDLCPDVATGTNSKINYIYYPVSGFPSILEQNSQFRMIIDLDVDPETVTPTNWTVTFKSHSDSDPQVYIINTGDITVTNDNTNDLFKLEFNLPANIVEDLYDVTLDVTVNTSDITETQYRVLKVVDQFKNTFNFVHLTDVHEMDPRVKLTTQPTIPPEEQPAVKSINGIMESINFLNPEFMIISGDMTYGAQAYNIEYEASWNRWLNVNVPSFKVPGNHDSYGFWLIQSLCIGTDGLSYYKDFFGPLYYSFDYGNFHFVGLNSMDRPLGDRLITVDIWGSLTTEQITWFEADCQAAHTAGKKIVVFLHHDPDKETTPGLAHHAVWNYTYNNSHTEFLRIAEENQIGFVFMGHDHYDDYHEYEYSGGKVRFIQTTTPASETRYDGYWGYRLVKVVDGEISSWDYMIPEFNSIPFESLEAEDQYSPLDTNPYLQFETVEGVNDGSSTQVSIKVTNNFPKEISGVLRFRVSSVYPTYEVLNGSIKSLSEGNSTKIYKINVTVDKNSFKIIKIRPGITPPESPENLTGLAKDSKVILYWDKVSVSDLTGYKVYYGTNNPPTNEVIVPVSSLANPDFPSYEVSSLMNNTLYYFMIKGYDDDNNESVESNIISVTPHIPPEPPTNLRLAVGNGSLTVLWDGSLNATGYKLYYGKSSGNYTGNDSNAGTSPIDVGLVEKFILSELENGQEYFITVLAYDNQNGGSDFATEVSDSPNASVANGDVNNDGEVTDLDYKLLLKSTVGLNRIKYALKLSIDLNKDEEIDLKDALILSRLTKGLNSPPVSLFTFSPKTCETEKTFNFDASESYDREDNSSNLLFRWDFDNDGTFDTNFSSSPTISHTYLDNNYHTITLEVQDQEGLTSKYTYWILPKIAEHLILLDIDAGMRDILYKGIYDHFSGNSATALPNLAEIVGNISWDNDNNVSFNSSNTFGANYGRSIFPTVTLATQSTIYNGNLPGYHGIMGNSWFNRGNLQYREYTGGDVLKVYFENMANDDLYDFVETIYTTHKRYYPQGKSVVLFNQYSKDASNWIIPTYTEFIKYLSSAHEYDNVCAYRAIEEIDLHGLSDLMTIYFAGHDHNSHEFGPYGDMSNNNADGQLDFFKTVIDYELGLLINGGTVNYEFKVSDPEKDFSFDGLKNINDPNVSGKTLYDTTVFCLTADHGQTGVKDESSHAVNFSQINPVTINGGFDTANSKNDNLSKYRSTDLLFDQKNSSQNYYDKKNYDSNINKNTISNIVYSSGLTPFIKNGNNREDIDYNEYDVVYCENGGSSFFYLKNRESNNWEDYPRFKEDTMVLAQEFAKANNTGSQIPYKCIDLMLVKKTYDYQGKQRSAGFYVYLGDGNEDINDQNWEKNYLKNPEEFFNTDVNKEKYPNGSHLIKYLEDYRSGDFYIVSNYNENKSYTDGYHFGFNSKQGDHGNLYKTDINIPFMFSGVPITENNLNGTIEEAGNYDFAPTAAQLLGMVMKHTTGKGKIYDLKDYSDVLSNDYVLSFPDTIFVSPNCKFNLPVIINNLKDLSGFNIQIKYEEPGNDLFDYDQVSSGYGLKNWDFEGKDFGYYTSNSAITTEIPKAGNGFLINNYLIGSSSLVVGNTYPISIKDAIYLDESGNKSKLNSNVVGQISVCIDSDGDNLPDLWELQYAATVNQLDANIDTDHDGLTDQEEYFYYTNPIKRDSDNDRLSDYDEIFTHFTNPNDNDTDNDGSYDGSEIMAASDPLDPESVSQNFVPLVFGHFIIIVFVSLAYSFFLLKKVKIRDKYYK